MIDNKTNFEEYFETYGLLGISPRLATELAQQKDFQDLCKTVDIEYSFGTLSFNEIGQVMRDIMQKVKVGMSEEEMKTIVKRAIKSRLEEKREEK